MQYYKNFNLKRYNSFRLNSIAKEIWFPCSNKELQELVIKLKNNKFFILSGGSNVLLKPKIDRIICLKSMPKYLNFMPMGIDVSASYSTTGFVYFSIKKGIKGFEGLFGIPGTLGGAIVMNAGSGKYTISDYLVSVTVLDISNGQLYITDKKSLNLKRRYSILQDTKNIIIGAVFNPPINSDLDELEKAKEHRKTLPHLPSAGGIFLNWHALKPYSKELIGLRIGDAEVSKSVNIIVNKGKATFDDIMTLIEKIQGIVKTPLQLEIKIL